MKSKWNFKLHRINHIILIHPGIQYTYRLASAIHQSDLVKRVSLYTWFTLKPNNFLAKFSIFNKRIKKIDKNVKVYNYPIFELILMAYLKLLALLKIDHGHTPRYQMQVCFAYCLLPMLYFKRHHTLLILSETAAWPLAYYAKKWNIPVVLDFPSISHEAAQKAEIKETAYGIRIKTLERQYIDYAFNCSAFASKTYQGITSAKKHYPIWLAADFKSLQMAHSTFSKDFLNISCLANTEKRKGLDILLLAYKEVSHPNKKLFLIGKIDDIWVSNFCRTHQIDQKHIVLSGALPQQQLTEYLTKHHINLHILASRFDSFGMVVPETMMLGIPNILSPFVGAGELLTHGVNGFLMDTLSVNCLIKNIDDFSELNSEAHETLIQQVKLKAKQMTWDTYNQNVSKVFKEILNDLSV